MNPLPTARVEKFQNAADLVTATAVLVRRGLVDPVRPDLLVKTARDTRRFGGLTAAIMQARRRRPGATALIDERGPISFRDLDSHSNALARGLTATGIRQGDVVALLARDHRGLVLAMLATSKVGARLVMMNTGFAKPQFADVVRREKVSAVLHDSEFFDLLDAVPADIPRVLTWCDEGAAVADTPTIDDLVARHDTNPLPPPAKPGGLVLLTSGTTGTPKGAPRDNVSPMLSAQILDRVPIGRNGTVLVAAPIFHGTGLGIFLLGLALGNRTILQRRFDAEATLRSIADHRAECVVVVPTMLQRILDLDDEIRAKYDTSALRIIYTAGSALSPTLCARTREVFGDVLHNMYGSTEVAVATIATPADLRDAPGTVGKPVLACKVALYDENRRLVTAPNVVGTIFVSSSTSFSGYTDGGHKEFADGLMCTNDVGHFDSSGRLFVDGRDDDMIVSGGENVYPLEVENLIASRDDVVEVAVIGVDDRDFGKRLAAFVVPSPTGGTSSDEIKEFVKDNLARHKVPRDVIFLQELPRNATGKVVRSALRTE